MSAFLLVLICVSLWALIPVVSKIGQITLDNHQFLFWSSLVSTVGLSIPLFFRWDVLKKYGFRDYAYMVFLGFLGTYFYYILLYYAYAKTRGIEVLILQYSWPLFTMLLSVLVLKESLNLQRIVAGFLGFLAVIIVITGGKPGSFYLSSVKVDLVVVFAAFVFALFSVLSKGVRYDPYVLNFVYFGSATVFSFISMLVFSGFAIPEGITWIPVLVNGLLVNGYSYLFWILALKRADASYVAPFVFITPVLSTFYLVVFMRERVSPVYGVGVSLLILSGLLNSKSSS